MSQEMLQAGMQMADGNGLSHVRVCLQIEGLIKVPLNPVRQWRRLVWDDEGFVANLKGALSGLAHRMHNSARHAVPNFTQHTPIPNGLKALVP